MEIMTRRRQSVGGIRRNRLQDVLENLRRIPRRSADGEVVRSGRGRVRRRRGRAQGMNVDVVADQRLGIVRRRRRGHRRRRRRRQLGPLGGEKRRKRL